MPAPALDVWFVSAEQVYRGVPFQVAAGWVEQGRLSAKDKVRPTKTNDPWQAVADHRLLADYLPVAAGAVATNPNAPPAEPLEAPEVEHPRKHADEDDDVDMIPLIDVSLVLLVFFMMTTSMPRNDALTEVPDTPVGVEVRKDENILTVQMDLRESGEAFYAIRVGAGRTLKPGDNNLVTLDEAMARVDNLVRQFSSPPEVRIACHKKVKHVRVRELAAKLDPYRLKGQITGYVAEVNQKQE